jgi:S-DNA-T family DNA segregation ATPase FtsK/SpoIIIE
MPRRKSLLRLPFFKAKLNRSTVFNVFGLIIFAAGSLILLSYFPGVTENNQGYFLIKIKNLSESFFGSLSLIFSVLTIFFSTYFFKSKKIKLIPENITVGFLFIFLSLLVWVQAGSLGKRLFDLLLFYLSIFGVYLFILVSFLLGVVLIFDTSLAVLFSLVYNYLLKFIKLVRKVFTDDRNQNHTEKIKLQKEEKFIETPKEKKLPHELIAPVTAKNDLQKDLSVTIKPISLSQKSTWVYPPISLIADIVQNKANRGDTRQNAESIERTLESFGIRAKVDEVNEGPSVTQYALKITMGTKLSRITALANDLALALAAPTGQVRIEAPIPGRSLVGIEIPNIVPEVVTLKRLFNSSVFTDNFDPLLVPLGLDVSGKPQAYSIGKMPHVLIAGSTGSGKSVLLNAWISTFLFRTRPDELRLILVDPKRVELTLYNGIPHLLTEVIVEPDKVVSALRWVIKEMDNRYKEFAKAGVRNIETYNQLDGIEKKPYIVFIIDELADLMIFAPTETEEAITRIAQMARATGIHLILATQRPSVDVITGLMKANIPTRIAFNVSSMIDSRVIIDMPGAEKLLGRGDMLFLPPDQAKPKRIQGPYINEKDVNQLVSFLKAQNPEIHYTEEITDQEVILNARKGGTMVIDDDAKDPLFDKAVEIIMQHDKASASLLQRRLSIGYARAARILDQLEQAGYVGPAEGSKPREVIKRTVDQISNE